MLNRKLPLMALASVCDCMQQWLKHHGVQEKHKQWAILNRHIKSAFLFLSFPPADQSAPKFPNILWGDLPSGEILFTCSRRNRVVIDCRDMLKWSAAPPPPDRKPKGHLHAGLLSGCALSYFMPRVNLLPVLRLDCRRKVYHVYWVENKGTFS